MKTEKNVGERARFKCPEQISNTAIEWSKDDSPLPDSKAFVTKAGPPSVLIIKPLKVRHSGIYKCLTVNGSVVLKTWELNVHSKLSIKYLLKVGKIFARVYCM